jgi:hypothetical protein
MPISEGMLVGRASATNVNVPIVVDTLLLIVAGGTGRQARAERPATDKRETARHQRREMRDRVARRDGPPIAELQEPLVPPRASVTVERRVSPVEDIGLPRSEAEAAFAAEAVTAEAFAEAAEAAVVGEAAAGGGRTSG